MHKNAKRLREERTSLSRALDLGIKIDHQHLTCLRVSSKWSKFRFFSILIAELTYPLYKLSIVNWIETLVKLYFIERIEQSSYASTQLFLCNSTPHKLLGRRPWNSTQRQVPLLTMSPWKIFLQKSSGSGSGDKNALFTFLLETILLRNGSFWNFAHEDIIDHQIISNGKKTHIC